MAFIDSSSTISIGAHSGANGVIIGSGANTSTLASGTVTISGTTRWLDGGDSHYVGFTAPGTQTGSISYVWPTFSSLGSGPNYLSSDASGNMQWLASTASGLTATNVGYGSAGGTLTGTSDFTWTDATNLLSLGSGLVNLSALGGSLTSYISVGGSGTTSGVFAAAVGVNDWFTGTSPGAMVLRNNNGNAVYIGTGSTNPQVKCLPTGALSLGTTSAVVVNITSTGAQIVAALDMNSHQINNVTDPTSAQDAATKNYIDSRKAAGTAFYTGSTTTSLTAGVWTSLSGTFTGLSLVNMTVVSSSNQLRYDGTPSITMMCTINVGFSYSTSATISFSLGINGTPILGSAWQVYVTGVLVNTVSTVESISTNGYYSIMALSDTNGTLTPYTAILSAISM